MLLAFTDESYSNRHYYQGAFIINEAHLSLLNNLIAETLEYVRGFGVLGEVELHGNSIMSASRGWEALNGNFGAKSAIYKYILRKISQLPGVLLIQGVNIELLNNRYKYPRAPHEITHRNLLDSIDKYSESVHQQALIFSDQITLQDDLYRDFQYYKIASTGGEWPRKLLHVTDVIYVESHLHPGIQIIDLCIFLFRRFDDHIEKNERTSREVEKMWKLLQPLIHPYFEPRIWRP